MRRITLAGCTLVSTVALLAPAVPAFGAGGSGNERFSGYLVATGTGSNPRHIERTQIVARGVVNAIGHIVEIPNRPTDSDNVTRDDLVFSTGTMHLKNINKSFRVHIDPQTCLLTVSISQVGTITGGTGRFAHAGGHFQGSVSGWGVAARGKNGACSTTKALVLEVDVVSAHGTLTP
jgi:hypothetical protein